MGIKIKLSPTQAIALSFVIIIFIGAVLLCQPAASRAGIATPFTDALFTATSAACVTGLVVYDTYSHWSIFGQLVILTLIQLGGLGIMTILSIFIAIFKRNMSIGERKLFSQSAGNIGIGGLLPLIKRIAIGTFAFELVGAALLAISFCQRLNTGEGIYYAVFHSISAFCNAGFDLCGRFEKFSSLTHYAGDVFVNIVIMALIVIGGIGFIVWRDISLYKFNFKKYSLHTKIVLVSSAILLFGGAFLFFIFEHNASMREMSFGNAVMASLFCSVSARTAGFNTVDLNALSESSNLLMIFLMLIGGSPGSTAGGIKTTTFAVVAACVAATVRRKSEVTMFKRKIDDRTVKQACSITAVYIAMVIISLLVVCFLHKISLTSAAFEITSAIGTVGASKGISSMIGGTSKIIVIFLMFAGRIGGLSLALMATDGRENAPVSRPAESISIG